VILVDSIAFVVITFFGFLFSLGIVQMLGVDREKVKYKTGKLTKPSKKQLLLALYGLIGTYIVFGMVILLNH
jgi:hypothetical protein